MLADFIVEFTLPEENTMSKLEIWTIQMDKSSAKKMGKVVITSPKGDILKYGVQFQFLATNNEKEYEAILTELRIAKSMEAKNILLKSDSKLVIGQIKGDYEAKEYRMQRYLKLMNQLAMELEQVEFMQVPRSLNSEADEVASVIRRQGRTTRDKTGSVEVPKHRRIPHIHNTR